MKDYSKLSKKYYNWLCVLSQYMMAHEIEMKDDDFYKGYYNAGYTPQEIVYDIDHFHNPCHP